MTSTLSRLTDDDSDSSDALLKGLGALAALAGLIAIIPIGAVWSAFALQHLWNWFATPRTGIHLGLAETVGLSALLGSLRIREYRKNKAKLGESLTYAFLAPGVLFLTGYFAHLAMGGR